MMEYYASIFGEYPFLAEKYAIAEFQHPAPWNTRRRRAWAGAG